MTTAFWISYGVLWILVVFGSLLVVGLFRELGRAYLSESESLYRDGSSVGSSLADVEVHVGDEDRTLGTLTHPSRLTLVLAVLRGCEVCVPTLEETLQDPFVRSEAAIVVIVADDEPGEYQVYGDRAVVAHLPQREVGRRLRVRAYPFAHVLDSAGVVQTRGPMFGARAAASLIRSVELSPNGSTTEFRDDRRQLDAVRLEKPTTGRR